MMATDLCSDCPENEDKYVWACIIIALPDKTVKTAGANLACTIVLKAYAKDCVSCSALVLVLKQYQNSAN